MLILDLNNGISTVAQGPDNGFLDGAAGLTRASRHNSNVSAVSNVITAAQPFLTAGVYGHGSAGRLLTYAQAISSVDQYLGLDNVLRWQNRIGGLTGQVRMLSLIGCHTGEGGAGYNLLRTFSEAIKMPVSAPTSDVIWSRYTDGREELTIDPSGTWQTVFPGRSASPIAGSRERFKMESIQRGALFHPTLGTLITTDQILEVRILLPEVGEFTEIAATELHSRYDINSFVRLFDGQRPRRIQGVFAAIKLAEFRLLFTLGTEPETLDLELLANYKLVVKGTETVFYVASDELVQQFS